VRYVSTRGEAPPLSFVDVALAGLARDGGLFVPEAWPRLDALARFAGQPYAEVAVEVMRPFVGEAIARLKALAVENTVTLVYAARDERHNNARALVEILRPQ